MTTKRIVVTGLVTVLTALVATPAAAAPHRTYEWDMNPTGTDVRLRAVAAVNSHIAWASGTNGTVLRTTDAGHTWQNVSPILDAGASTNIRDIEAFDSRHAVALAIGGTDGRIWTTDDAGATWTESFRGTDPNEFYDCIAFGDRMHGLGFSDPIDGKIRVISTADGGKSWSIVDPAGMPEALFQETGLAASGGCIQAVGRDEYFIGTAGASLARVFHTTDSGQHWTVSNTPIKSSVTAGLSGMAFQDAWRGVAVGGDFRTLDKPGELLGLTADRGATWGPFVNSAPASFRSSVAFVRGYGDTYVAVGPKGSEVSADGGQSWTSLNTAGFDSVNCDEGGHCWAVGVNGQVGRLIIRH